MYDTLSMYPEDKSELYELLHSQLKALLDNEAFLIPNLSNAAALLAGALENINWAGFYLIHKDELLLGPFQGKPACIHIPIGKGVCGTAVSEGKTQLVHDVHKFPGHIACDSASRSELVVPLYAKGELVGVLDIDSPVTGRFDQVDQNGLEEFAKILANGSDWS